MEVIFTKIYHGGTFSEVYQNLYSSSQPSSVCNDTTSVPRAPQKEVQGGLGRGLGRKKANARGTPFVSETCDSSSQMPPKSSLKRPYNSALFSAATGRNRRPTSGFGVYSDPTTGTQVFNPGTLSEMVLQGPTNLKSASPCNIDIGFKPRGLKWNGSDAVTASQLQQMRENKKKRQMRENKKKRWQQLVKPPKSSLSRKLLGFWDMLKGFLNNVI